MNIKSVFESWSWSSWLQWLYWEAPILKKIGYKRALLESAKKKQSTKCLSVFFKFGLPWLQWSLQMADMSHQKLQNLKGILHLNISIAYQISYWASVIEHCICSETLMQPLCDRVFDCALSHSVKESETDLIFDAFFYREVNPSLRHSIPQ